MSIKQQPAQNNKKQRRMKNITSIFCIALTAILTPTTGYGNFSGSDDFNDNSKDLAKWGTDIAGGLGTLTETSQGLQYTASGSSDPESFLRPWIANHGSFTSDWTLQIDVNVPTLTLTTGQRCEFGLQVSNGDHSTDLFGAGLRLNDASGTPIREFHSGFKVNGADQVIGGVNSPTTSTSASVRIRYDAATTTLFAEFDANGAVGGYNFTTFDSRNIAGWNMTAISVFDAGAGGMSKGNVVISSTDNVRGDNFLAGPVGPEPSSYFPIATKGAVMSYAFDGSNYLVGVENHLTFPTTIGAQMIASNGTKVGSLITTGRSGISTAVAFDGTNYLMIWQDDGLGTLNGNTGWEIYGQFISKPGVVAGPPFAITTNGIWFDGIKTMTFGGGKYLVTYTRLIVPAYGEASNNRYIAGRMVNPDGTLGSEFRISTGFGKASDVAFDGTNFFVVWCEDFADTEIRGRFVSPAGVLGAELSVNASAAPSDNPKSVTFDGTNYLVVWNDEVGGKDTGTWDSFGQLVSTSGALVGEKITLTSEAGPQMVTSVAFDGANYLAVWVDMQNGTNWDMYGQYISRNGSLVGNKITISTDTGNQMGGVGFANGKYLVLVNNGVILGQGGLSHVDSATGVFVTPPTNPQVQTSDASFGVRTNRFGFTLTGTSGLVIVVEACTDLAHPIWSPLQTNTLTGGSYYFSDPAWTNYPGRFYRLRSP